MDVPFIPDIDPIQVDTNGVVKLLNSLEVHKSAVPAEIPAQFLKETRNLLAPSLTLYLPSITIPVLLTNRLGKSTCCTNFQEGQSYHI